MEWDLRLLLAYPRHAFKMDLRNSVEHPQQRRQCQIRGLVETETCEELTARLDEDCILSQGNIRLCMVFQYVLGCEGRGVGRLADAEGVNRTSVAESIV